MALAATLVGSRISSLALPSVSAKLSPSSHSSRTLLNPSPTHPLPESAIAGALFSSLASSHPALISHCFRNANGLSLGLGLGAVASLISSPHASAAQEIVDLAADNDSRGLLLLIVLVPAIGWVLFNILQPALNQISKMRSTKGLIGAIGLGAAASAIFSPQADAVQDLASVADNDSRGLLVLGILIPAVGWVLFNILKPALNQVDKMRSAKGVAGAIGLGAASAIFTPQADAAVQEIANLADNDSRGTLLLGVLVPAIAWVLFNILQP